MRINWRARGRAALIVAALGGASLSTASAQDDEGAREQFTFSWPYADGDSMRPRGGTTRGMPVELATEPSEAWRELKEPGLSNFERDRRAILAMAGPYRASFDFVETVVFDPAAEPAQPYQSWGTEYVYVAEDSGTFISLQHMLVMFVEEDDGEVQGPFVVKHWRQDWRYEDRDMHVYVGDRTWEHRRISAGTARGAWTQAVSQVDDSPRYEAAGRWVHEPDFSVWTSERTWRPLPRREFSVRSDYDVLDGVNRHTIVPTGWVHEQNNLKLVLNENGEPAEDERYLARELGVNRYERLEDFDFSAGHEYWSRTEEYWLLVRTAWEEVYADHDRFRVADERDGRTLYERLFEYAEDIDADDFDAEAARTFVRETIDEYVTVATP